MNTLTLTNDEANVLRSTLGEVLSNLRMEIAHTDNSAFKANLRERRGVLETLLEKLAPAPHAG